MVQWGDPSDLQEYEGGRDYDALKEFADANLKPMCSIKNIDLCDDDKKAEIKKFQDMSTADLEAAIEAEEKKITDAEEKFETKLEELQQTYQNISEEKDDAIAAVKAAGLGLMKAVKADKASATKDEL